MQPPWLAQQEKAAQIIYRLLRAQLLEIGDIVALDHLFPWKLPRQIQGAKAYFHSTDIPVDQLSPGKDGCVYIEMRTKLGGHSSGVQPLTLTGAIDQKFFKKSPPQPKKTDPKFEVFAGATFIRAYKHAITNKSFGQDTMLVVVFNENCATYKHMRKTKKTMLCTAVCGILVLKADGKPAPGVLLVELTISTSVLRIVSNTLHVTGDEVFPFPTLPEDVCVTCPNNHVPRWDPWSSEDVAQVSGSCR
jgi:hypothetical protein